MRTFCCFISPSGPGLFDVAGQHAKLGDGRAAPNFGYFGRQAKIGQRLLDDLFFGVDLVFVHG